MKSTLILPVFVFVTSFCFSDEVTDFFKERDREIANIQRENSREIQKQKKEFDDWLNKSEAEFEKWEIKRKRELQAFINTIKKSWGTYITPTNKRWVEYSLDHTSVSSVDFEKGRVTVAVLVDAQAGKDQMKEQLIDAVTRTVASKGSRKVIPVEAEKMVQYLPAPVLADQIADPKGEVITVSGVSEFARGLVEESRIITTPVPVTPTISQKKTAAHLTFSLVPDHLQKRIDRFLPLVEKYCKKYDVNRAHVLATIHTESHFNPMANSSANAIGLMQLVPQSGAREAYGLVYGVDIIPREAFLLEAEHNIELGCAYIHILQTRYFAPVKSPGSRRYCSIAAYNTGPRNVACAFLGERSLKRAIPVINKLNSPDKVYNRLISGLPYRETRQYLALVAERIELYKN